jgi:hypothetical protein
MTTKTSASLPGCSCGETLPHVIARRTTADGVSVEVWHDGAVTGRSGNALPGVPVARPRTASGLDLARRTATLFADEVSLYDVAELPRLYACARRLAERGGSPGHVRAVPSAEDVPALRLAWVTYQADRDDRPVVRVARLDRARWPGLAVWHERGKYELMALTWRAAPGARSEEVLEPTGFSFGSQRALRDHLFNVQGSAVVGDARVAP